MLVKSPLTGRSNVTLTRKLSCEYLVKLWQQSFGIDISEEFNGEEVVCEYQCCDTGLLFFHPSSLVGSAHVYQELQKFDWYYIPEKWEHRQIITQVKPGMRILEVGCGEGSFLSRCNNKGADAFGLELNEAAVEVGRSKGLQITNEPLEKFSISHANQFDVVCCFQVLEHVAEPKEFIANCLNVAKPGGLVIFGVPNAESFFGRQFSILDLPPHHMLRWSKPAFSSLSSFFQMSLQSIQYEPLATYHIEWLLGLLKKTKRPSSRLFRLKFFEKIARVLLKSGGRKLIKGHTILAVFKKN